ncbi:MAG: glycerol-3-phosphate 1-O-acyltransferase PlsY [Bacteroidota bacterium]
MDYIQILSCTLLAYLIGSIPTSIWLSKLYYGIDIREHGSGSASHLNVSRILGKKAAYLVRFIDLVKGFVAANLAYFFHKQYGIFSDFELPILMMCFGLAAIIGHIFPAFAGLRGGKGFHTSIGALIAINPLASLVLILITLLIVAMFKYPNLGYVAGAFSLPVFVILSRPGFDEFYYLPTLVFSLFFCSMLMLTHRHNLIRILRYGDDHRISLRGF